MSCVHRLLFLRSLALPIHVLALCSIERWVSLSSLGLGHVFGLRLMNMKCEARHNQSIPFAGIGSADILKRFAKYLTPCRIGLSLFDNLNSNLFTVWSFLSAPTDR